MVHHQLQFIFITRNLELPRFTKPEDDDILPLPVSKLGSHFNLIKSKHSCIVAPLECLEHRSSPCILNF